MGDFNELSFLPRLIYMLCFCILVPSNALPVWPSAVLELRGASGGLAPLVHMSAPLNTARSWGSRGPSFGPLSSTWKICNFC